VIYWQGTSQRELLWWRCHSPKAAALRGCSPTVKRAVLSSGDVAGSTRFDKRFDIWNWLKLLDLLANSGASSRELGLPNCCRRLWSFSSFDSARLKHDAAP
jgi:hypothetical protein